MAAVLLGSVLALVQEAIDSDEARASHSFTRPTTGDSRLRWEASGGSIYRIKEGESRGFTFANMCPGEQLRHTTVRSTAEAGDFTWNRASYNVASGGTGCNLTNSNPSQIFTLAADHDADTDDERFTFWLTSNLNPNGTHRSGERWRFTGYIEVVIADDDATPAAPANFTAAPSDKQVTLTWDAPPQPVTAWELKQGSANWAAITPTGRPEEPRQHIVTGLDNGTAYTFQVRAKNARGTGTATSALTSTPQLSNYAPANPPANLRAVARYRGANLSWEAPTGPLTTYAYRHRAGNGAWSNWTKINGTWLRHAVSGNQFTGSTYSFQVRAENGSAVGPGSNVATVNPRGNPGGVGNFTAQAGNASALLSWHGIPSDERVLIRSRNKTDNGPYTAWIDAGSGTSYTVTGLDNGDEYRFQARRERGGHNGVLTDEVSATPSSGLPGVARNLRPTEVSGTRIKAAWDAPASGTVASYVLRYRLQNTNGTWASWENFGVINQVTNRTATISGLTANRTYQLWLSTCGRAGGLDCGPNTYLTVTTTAPSGITNGQVAWNAAGTGATASWELGTGTASGYKVRVRPRIPSGPKHSATESWGSWTGFTTTTDGHRPNTTISSLNSANTYNVQIAPQNGTSRRLEVHIAYLFGQVRYLEAAPTDSAGVNLSWVHPPTAFASITRYEYRFRPSGGTWTGWLATTGAGATQPITGLVPGQAYNFQVRAVSTSAGSAGHVVNGFPATVNATATVGKPAAPSGLRSVEGDGRMTLHWGHSGRAADKWQYCFRTGSQSCLATNASVWSDVPNSNAATRSAVLSPLTNNTAYTFHVRGVNVGGNGTDASVTGTPKAGSSKVYWTLNTGGTTSIRRSNLDGSLAETVVTGLATARWLTIDAAGGKMYWTEVGLDEADDDDLRSANLDGTGVTTVVPDVDVAGGSIQGVAVDPIGGKLYWVESGSSDRVRRANLDGSGIENVATLGAANPRGIALDVDGGKAYWADNGTDEIHIANLGGGGISTHIDLGTADKTPTGVAVDVANNWIYWTDEEKAGSNRGGIYRAKLSDGTGATRIVHDSRFGTWDIALDVSGGKLYWANHGLGGRKIQSANLDGTSVADVKTNENAARGLALLLVPGAPRDVAAAPSDTAATVTWKAPTIDAGGSAAGYEYRYKAGTAAYTQWAAATGATLSRGTYSLEVTGLTNNTLHKFEVRGVNRAGAGAASAEAEVTPAELPAKPSGLTATAGNAEVTLNWTDPGNSSITGYEVCQKSDGTACASGDWSAISNSDKDTTEYEATSLTNYTEYSFRIRAVNTVGKGTASDAVTATPKLPLPAALNYFHVNARDGRVQIGWERPSGYATITKYQYQQSSSTDFSTAEWVDLAPGDLTRVGTPGFYDLHATIDGLTNGAVRYFRARSVNRTGAGPISGAVGALTVSENASATYSVRLSGAPASNVTVNNRSSVVGGFNPIIISPSTTTFTPSNWNVDQIITVTGANDHFSNQRSDSNTESFNTASVRHRIGSSTVPQGISDVSIAVLDDDIILSNMGNRIIRQGAICSNAQSRDCKQAGSFTTGSHASGYTLTSAVLALNWSHGLHSATINEVAVYTNKTTGCASGGNRAATSCPDAKVGSNLTKGGNQSITRGTGTYNQGVQNAAGIALAANTKYWLVVDIQHPVATRYSNSANENSPEGWTIGERLLADHGASGWRYYAGATVAMAMTLGAKRLPAAPTGFAVSAGNAAATLTWTNPFNSEITKYQYCQKTTASDACDDSGDWTDIPNSDESTVRHVVTGLTNTTPYYFKLRAFVAGPGAASVERTATPVSGPPAAPDGLTASAMDKSVELTWNNPRNSTITGYKICQKTGTTATCVDADYTAIANSGETTTSHVVTGLSNGTAYAFRIRAVNSEGDGTASASVSATPTPVPAAPTGVTAVPATGAVTINWTGPTDSTITKYQYRYKLNSASSWPATWTDVSGDDTTRTTGSISGLTDGTSYNFQLRAVNASGNGAAATISVAPGVPAAPANLSAKPGDTEVTLTWDNPNNSAILRYQIQRKDGDAAYSGWSNITGSSASTVSHKIESLTNGTEYKFKIRAVGTGNTDGAESVEVSATPVPLPVAPTNFAGAPGNEQVKLTWNNPSNSTITKYQYCQKTGAATCSATTDADWTDISGSGAATVMATLTGLSNGTAYKFQLRAVNPAGGGPASSVVTLTPVRVVLSVAPNPVAEGATATVTASLEGGAAASAVTVTVAAAAGSTNPAESDDYTLSTNKTLTIPVGASASSGVVTIATSTDTDTANETVTVSGTVSGGGGFLSAPANQTLTINDSARPQLVWVVGGTQVAPGGTVSVTENGSLTVRLRALGTTSLGASGCNPNAQLTLGTAESGDLSWQSRTNAMQWPGTGTDILSSTITLLANADGDTDHETATLSLLNNGCFSSVPATEQPNEPAPITVIILDDDAPRVTLNLSANPVAEGSSTTVTASVVGTTTAATTVTVAATQGSAASSDFSISSNKTLSIAAGATTSTGTVTIATTQDTDSVDETVIVSATVTNTTDNPIAPPDVTLLINDDERVPFAPVGVTATKGNAQVTLAWTGPANATVDEYEYCQSESASDACDQAGDWDDMTSSGATTRSYVVGSLDNGTKYYFKIRAVNGAGNGAASAEVSATPQVPAPAKPTGLTASPRNAGAVLSWDDPSDSSITKYQVCQKQAATATCADGDFSDISGSGATTTSHTISSGLTNGQAYSWRIRAVNATGTGEASDSATATPRAIPAAPTGLTAQPASGQVTLNWTDPSNSSITGYEYRYKLSTDTNFPTNWTAVSDSGATTITTGAISSLNNGSLYNFELRATSNSGNGTVASVNATPNPVPSALTGVTVAPKDASADLTWTVPTNTSGTTNNTTITKFEYQVCAYPCVNFTDWAQIPSTTSSSRSGTITGLTNGTTYNVRVRGVNPSGPGPNGGTYATTPVARPAAPTSFTATAGNTKVTLSWTAPSGTVTRYEYRYGTDNPPTGNWTSSGTTTNQVVSSLTNTTTYYFQVRAVNGSGNGTATAALAATPPGAPAKATGFTASPRNASVVLSWTDPNNSAIDKWQYRYKEATSSTWGNWTNFTSSATTTTVTVGSLQNGTEYDFRIRAVIDGTGGGNGPDSDVKKATPAATPAAPTALAAQPASGQVTLTWTAPAGTITRYDYRYGTANPPTGGWTSSGTTTNQVVSSLQDGTTYYFQVRAVSASGNGTATAALAATPNPVPSAPTSLAAAPKHASVDLTWTVPANTGTSTNNSTITEFEYQQSSSSTFTGDTWTDIPGTTGSSRSGTISGLTNGTTYYFRIRAVSPSGNSTASNVANTAPVARPGAPTSFTATAGNTKVTLAWTKPSGPITGYEYQQKTGTGNYGAWTPIPSSGSATVSYELTGLTNGTAYAFKVRAKNNSGDGAASAEATATPPGLPAKPEGFSASPRSASVVLTWDDPSNSAISKWQFQYKASSATNWITWADVPSSSATTTTHTISSLSNGTAYDFQVRAVTGGTGGGNGPASDTKSATPAAVPAKPSGFDAQPANGVVNLSWTNPNNSTITEYQLNQKVGSAAYSGWNPISLSTSSTTSVQVTATNGTEYRFKIRAVNLSGVGPESDEVTATPNPVPTAMSSLGATAGNTKVTLAWTIPANTANTTNNSTITGYEYQQRTTESSWSGITTWTTLTATGTGSNRTAEVTGLSNNTAYTFRIRAVNPSGDGPASGDASATPPGLPAKPSGFTASPRNVSVYLAWTDPGNSAISKWEYQRRLGTASNWPSTWTTMSTSATATSFTVTGLDNGTEYDFRIRAVTGGTGGGNGPISDVKSATPAATPAAPTALAAQPASGEVALTWTAPAGTITDYDVCAKTSNAACTDAEWTSTGSTTASHTVSSLTNGTTYYFRVRAVNLSGDGAATAALSATPNPVPSTPTGLSATGKVQSVTLSWTIPANTSGTTNNSTITKWQYQQRTTESNWSGIDWEDLTATGTGSNRTATVGSLDNDTAYTFRIRAVNPSGNSTPTGDVSATPRALPGAPTSLGATAGSGSVSLSWTAPASSTVTGYRYCRKTSSTEACGSGDWSSAGTGTTFNVTGLNNGTTYYFRVRAVNLGGAGPQSNQASAMPVGPPAAPSNFTATAGNTRVTLEWANPNNASITRYEYRQKTGSAAYGSWTPITNSGPATVRHVVTGLTNTTVYRFKVRAVNNSGDGAESAERTATPNIAVPDAPTGLVALPFGASINLSWADPQDSTITRYELRRSTSSSFSGVSFSAISGSGAATTKVSVSGLTAGTRYWFELRAVNSGGEGAVASIAATPGTAFAPTGLTATPGDTEVTLTWDFMYLYPAITKYQVCEKTGTATCDADTADDWEDFTGTNSTLRYVVTGLDNDTEYRFRIRAVTAIGGNDRVSPPSNAATATPASSAVPVAPYGLSISAGDAKVTLSWTDPGDSSITKYQYCDTTGSTAGTCSSGDWSDFSPATNATSTSGSVSSLTNNVKHWFRIRAVNANGGSDASVALTATPLAAPVLETPAVADRRATLKWSVSAGATLYQYCAKTDSTACADTDWINVPADEPETPTDDPATLVATVLGLSNDTTYTFKVRAINAAWTLVESNTVTVMPTHPPRRPTGLTATAGNGQVTLSWTAPPVGPHDGAATGYQYCVKFDNTACSGTDWKTAGTTTSYIVQNLTNGRLYKFWVRGTNGHDRPGNPSNPKTARPTAP